ncbi:MAG TPA: TRAM domain-containing protein [Candidatus Binatus sp.]|nr:TRAM domain-containing protein [Candidatus Binatus sp.]
MEDEEEFEDTETQGGESNEAKDNEHDESRSEEAGTESDSEPRETFRQGYGSGRKRPNPLPSQSGGGRGFGERRGGRTGGYGRRESYGGGGSEGRRDRGFGRDRGEQDRGPVPVEEGQELTLTIDALGRRGDGIARINNFVIFVPGGQAGDQVKVRITTVRGSFATGEIVS